MSEDEGVEELSQQLQLSQRGKTIQESESAKNANDQAVVHCEPLTDSNTEVRIDEDMWVCVAEKDVCLA